VKIQLYACLISVTFVTGCTPTSDVLYRTGPVKQHVGQQRRPQAPVLKRLKNGHYKVLKPWTVTAGGHCWQIPVGYSSNGITAPARIKVSLGDGINHPETWAAVFHDWSFTQKGVSRKQSDRMFRELLIDYGVSKSKADLMYTFVSAFSVSKTFRSNRTQPD
jgi:Protein of unknown function (DUF1353)